METKKRPQRPPTYRGNGSFVNGDVSSEDDAEVSCTCQPYQMALWATPTYFSVFDIRHNAHGKASLCFWRQPLVHAACRICQ